MYTHGTDSRANSFWESATFLALAEHLEEQFGADIRERHIVQLGDVQQLDASINATILRG